MTTTKTTTERRDAVLSELENVQRDYDQLMVGLYALEARRTELKNEIKRLTSELGHYNFTKEKNQ